MLKWAFCYFKSKFLIYDTLKRAEISGFFKGNEISYLCMQTRLSVAEILSKNNFIKLFYEQTSSNNSFKIRGSYDCCSISAKADSSCPLAIFEAVFSHAREGSKILTEFFC